MIILTLSKQYQEKWKWQSGKGTDAQHFTFRFKMDNHTIEFPNSLPLKQVNRILKEYENDYLQQHQELVLEAQITDEEIEESCVLVKKKVPHATITWKKQ